MLIIRVQLLNSYYKGANNRLLSSEKTQINVKIKVNIQGTYE